MMRLPNLSWMWRQKGTCHWAMTSHWDSDLEQGQGVFTLTEDVFRSTYDSLSPSRTNRNRLMGIGTLSLVHKRARRHHCTIHFGMIDRKIGKELKMRKVTWLFHLLLSTRFHSPSGPIMKSSKRIRMMVVARMTRFKVNNNCHKRHIHKPCLRASEMSSSRSRRRYSSVDLDGSDSTDTGEDGGVSI